MIVDNVYDLALNIFVGTNFFELWGHEDNQYPLYVNIHTGFVITMSVTSSDLGL